MSNNNSSYYLEMANLQIATEAIWDGWDPKKNPDTSTWTDNSLTQDEIRIKEILTSVNSHLIRLSDDETELIRNGLRVWIKTYNKNLFFCQTLVPVDVFCCFIKF